MATHVFIIVLLVFQVAHGSENRQGGSQGGLFDKISSGMKFASDFLASDSIASKVAEFVVKAFQTNLTPPRRPAPIKEYVEDSRSDEKYSEETKPNFQVNEAPNPIAPLQYLVKLLGLQPNQISAVAVNALVFVAQMISTFLAGPVRPPKPYRTEDPTSWILNKNSRTLQELISKAKNESIIHDIDNIIQQQGDETSCIRLLVCKITPFVHKMQDTVFGNKNDNSEEKLRGAEVMYRHLPTAKEIKDSSDICEQRHKDCDVNE